MNNIYDYQSAALWKDENFDLANLTGGGSLPDPATLPGTSIIALAFDGSNTAEQVFGCKELNHDYKEGTVIKPHVHWYPSTNVATGNVKWQLEYFAQNSEVSGVTASGIISAISTASGGAYTMRYAFFPDINFGPLAKIGTQVHFRFFRNPSDAQDTYGADAVTATFGWHYQTDMRGSIQVASKL
jgi:hypothetical protein